MNKKTPVSLEELKEYLSYNKDSGVFLWKKSTRIIDISDEVAGSENDQGYIIICIKGKKYRAHRLAWLFMTEDWPPFDIDHRNLIRNDNRWINLRKATRSQNNMNSGVRINNSTGYRGVSWSEKYKYYHSYINFNGKRTNIGYYNNAIEAAKAYDKKSYELYSEFAFLNFPEELDV